MGLCLRCSLGTWLSGAAAAALTEKWGRCDRAAPVPGQPLRHGWRGTATHGWLLGKNQLWTKDDEKQGN